MAEVTMNIPEPKRHDNPLIDAFLKDGSYANIDEWMLDSDYEDDGDNGWLYEGSPVDADEAIMGAIEACGFDG
jgi:hypothetical protein